MESFQFGVRMMNDDSNSCMLIPDLDIRDVHLIHKSLDFHYKKWPGGHPQEQEGISMMRDNFYRIILEHQFREPVINMCR